MKCIVCGCQLTDNTARCPACGFPVLQIPLQEENNNGKINEMAAIYKKKILKDINISVAIYLQDNSKNKLVRNKEEILSLSDCYSLMNGKVKWNDKEFAQVDDSEDLELLMVIMKNGREVNRSVFSTKVPGTEGFWHIGVKMTESLKIQLLLTDGRNVTQSSLKPLYELVELA